MDVIKFPQKKEESSLQIINDTPRYRIEILVDKGYDLILTNPKGGQLPHPRPMICPACDMAVHHDGEVHFRLSVFSKEDGSTTLLRYHLACYDKSLRKMFDEVLDANKESEVQTDKIPVVKG